MNVHASFTTKIVLLSTLYLAALAWRFEDDNFIDDEDDIDDDDQSECHEVDVANGEYSYEQRFQWPELYPSFCAGTFQSPINIDLESESVITQLFPTQLDLSAFGTKQDNATMVNDGHSVVVTVPGDIVITGGAAQENVFILNSFHFHFGDSYYDGTEHRINGMAFSMEIHFVFINTKYSNFEEAANNKDGILVLAVFVMTYPYGMDMSGLNFITENLNQIADPRLRNTTTVQGPIDLSQLLPEKGGPESYFTYFGSLTTPLCHEAVTWVILSKILWISDNQMETFQELLDKCGDTLSGNIRPIQELNGRQIIYVGMDSK